VVARFDGRNPRAEAFLKTQSSELIVGILDDSRTSIREVLRSGMQEGRNPRRVALDIVGRLNRGKREGGLIGLSPKDIDASQLAHAQLRSGDPEQLRAYLRRKARDKRFDATVKKAIRDGKPVPAEKAAKITGRYRDKLLRLRGETIARTEMLRSLHEAQDEGLRQLIDAGKLRPEQVTRVWDTSGDARVRPSHAAIDETPAGLDGVFVTGDGSSLKYPGDTSLEAGPEDVINCRCHLRVEIDYMQGLT